MILEAVILAGSGGAAYWFWRHRQEVMVREEKEQRAGRKLAPEEEASPGDVAAFERDVVLRAQTQQRRSDAIAEGVVKVLDAPGYLEAEAERRLVGITQVSTERLITLVGVGVILTGGLVAVKLVRRRRGLA